MNPGEQISTRFMNKNMFGESGSGEGQFGSGSDAYVMQQLAQGGELPDINGRVQRGPIHLKNQAVYTG